MNKIDIIILIMGGKKKECTPTLFPASVMEAGWVKSSVGYTTHPASFVHLSCPL